MSRETEFFLVPGEYLAGGDRPIKAPPLINTSLKELAEMGWYLTIYARYIKGYGHTKLKFHFSDPDNKKGYPYLTFRMWVKGDVTTFEGVLFHLLQADLTPNWTKVPQFNLVPPNAREESEIEYLKRINAERAKTLPKKKIDRGALEQRVAKIISFPMRFGHDDGRNPLHHSEERLVS